ncbi:MAG: hypothetical protein ABRQ39_11895 [Candidatus Eremiobacterota bacterium]
MKIKFLTIMLLLLTVPAMAQVEQTVGGYNYKSGLFKDPLNRFSINFPAGWLGHSEEKGGPVEFIACKNSHFGSCSIKILKEEDYTLEKLRKRVISEGVDPKKVTVLSETDVTLDGYPVKCLRLTQEGMVADIYYFIKGKKPYVIQLGTDSKGYDIFKKEFKSIIDTFKFNRD